MHIQYSLYIFFWCHPKIHIDTEWIMGLDLFIKQIQECGLITMRPIICKSQESTVSVNWIKQKEGATCTIT